MAPALHTTRNIAFPDKVIHGHAVVNATWHFYLVEQDEDIMCGYMCKEKGKFTQTQFGHINIHEVSNPDVWGVEVKWESNWKPKPVKEIIR